MDTLFRYINPSDGSDSILEALDDDIMRNTLVPRRYILANVDAIDDAVKVLDEPIVPGSPSFCLNARGDGIYNHYLKSYIKKDKVSSLLYFTGLRADLVSALCYDYDDDHNAIHVIAFCLNQKKNFGVKGYEIIDEVKELVRHAIHASGIKTIILESVDTAVDFYKRQGFKRNLRRSQSGLKAMFSHYAPRIDTKGKERWSPEGATPEVSSKSRWSYEEPSSTHTPSGSKKVSSQGDKKVSSQGSKKTSSSGAKRKPVAVVQIHPIVKEQSLLFILIQPVNLEIHIHFTTH